MVPRRHLRQGFTFLELILVAAVMSILVAVSVPQFRKSFDSLVFQNFISDLTSFAGYAQAKAVTNSSEMRVNIDLQQKRLLLESRMPSGGTLTLGTEEWRIEKTKVIPDSLSVDLKGGSGEIKFYPDGTSDKAEFAVTDRYGIECSVFVEPGTGYVDVKKTE